MIIDTDGGVDDACALWWALTDPSIDLVAVTVVWGNVDVAVATQSVRRVLAAAGRPEIPVAVGSAGPIGPAPTLARATFIHGEDGLGGDQGLGGDDSVPERAPDLLRRMTSERPGEISLVTIGPLSTIGALVTADPSWAATIDELVVMGGAVRSGGNALPRGEANIAHDPGAAAAVVGARWKQPPLLVGLDVTHQATISPAEMELLKEHRSAAAEFLDAPLSFYRRRGAAFTAPDCPCHDLVALLAWSDPGLVTEAPLLPLAVDTGGGPAWGSTVVDMRGWEAAEGRETFLAPPGYVPWRVALGVDVARFRRRVGILFGDPARPAREG